MLLYVVLSCPYKNGLLFFEDSSHIIDVGVYTLKEKNYRAVAIFIREICPYNHKKKHKHTI